MVVDDIATTSCEIETQAGRAEPVPSAARIGPGAVSLRADRPRRCALAALARAEVVVWRSRLNYRLANTYSLGQLLPKDRNPYFAW